MCGSSVIANKGSRGWKNTVVQTQGKVERFHGSMVAALLRRGTPRGDHRQAWLDQFRYEHNYLRPHEALKMKTPAQLWQKSGREYQLCPAQWIYPSGTEVAEVDRSGSIRIDGRRRYLTHIGRSASGCNRSGTTIFSSLSAYTDRRNRSAQVPIHGRGSGLSGFTGKPKV